MEKIEIVVATNNQHKMEEFKELFKDLNVKLYSLKDLNIDINVEENGDDFKSNSLIKAKAVKKLTDKWVIADDSGLEVEALDGFPGIFSSRFMAKSDYITKCNAIIALLGNNPNRNAQFNCVITLIDNDNNQYFFQGISKGKIATRLFGNKGFGFDPIFISDKILMSFAEMDSKTKNLVSHRGIASQKLKEFIIEYTFKNQNN